ncbi:MAG: hypothetical protein QMD22_10350 [archaeon]|nr:hypothetical protein [archaeon]
MAEEKKRLFEKPQEDMVNWGDGMYPRRERCPKCGSTNTSVAIHGAIRQWWCQNCGEPFMPEGLRVIRNGW